MNFWGTHPGEANVPLYLNALFSEQVRLRRIKKFIQRSEKGL